MTTATLIRVHRGAETRARETYDTDPQVDVLYEGDLAGAIAAARAIPADQRLELTIETDEAHYGPDDFDSLTPAGAPLRDLELMHGAGAILIEKAALARLVGNGAVPPQPMSIVTDHIDTITVIVRHKQVTEDIETVDGKRLIRITAADIDAA